MTRPDIFPRQNRFDFHARKRPGGRGPKGRGTFVAWGCVAALAFGSLPLGGCSSSDAQEGVRTNAPAQAASAAPERGAENERWDRLSEKEVTALANVAPAAGPNTSSSTSDSAALFVKQLGDSAIAVLTNPSLRPRQRIQGLRNLLNWGFDVDAMSRIVLGRYWRAATPAQRAEYRALFQEFIVAIYTARFSKYSGESMKITGARASKRSIVIVSSLIERPGKATVRVDWLVRRSAGRHHIIDIVVEGISMAMTQRSEFASIIQSNGGTVEGLLVALRARIT